MNDCVIATGWHSNGKSPNPGVSEKCYKANWLLEYWIPFNLSQIHPADTSLYVSDCLIKPLGYDSFSNISFASLANDHYHTRHDWWSSVLSGAMYAYNNNLHLVYVEQDCFVWGLDKAIRWALDQKAKICYGFGNVSYRSGWSENSFTFVHKDFIDDFIIRAISSNADRSTDFVLEILFHELYKDVFTPWPFGYGRKPVQDWNHEIFYKQQLTNNDIDKFMSL